MTTFLLIGMFGLGLLFFLSVLYYSGLLLAAVMVVAFYAANYTAAILGIVSYILLVFLFGEYYSALAFAFSMLLYLAVVIYILRSVYTRMKGRFRGSKT